MEKCQWYPDVFKVPTDKGALQEKDALHTRGHRLPTNVCSCDMSREVQ